VSPVSWLAIGLRRLPLLGVTGVELRRCCSEYCSCRASPPGPTLRSRLVAGVTRLDVDHLAALAEVTLVAQRMTCTSPPPKSWWNGMSARWRAPLDRRLQEAAWWRAQVPESGAAGSSSARG